MSRELANLDASELSGTDSSSSSELKDKINALVSTPEPQDEEIETEEVIPEVQEEESTQELGGETEIEEEEEVIPPQPKPSAEILTLQRQVQDLTAMLKEQNKPQPKKLTKAEILEKFAEDPEGFMESFNKPLREENFKLQESQLRNQARITNPEFARLESVIDSIIKVKPDLAKNSTAAERLQVYYLLAKGAEAEDKALKSRRKELIDKNKRLVAKKKASSLPKATKKGSGETTKPLDKMTASEIKAKINSMVSGQA